MKIDVVHSDTTSWSLTGVYEDSSPDGDAMHITYGYNGNHRPDLKQFNYGLAVSRDGISTIGEDDVPNFVEFEVAAPSSVVIKRSCGKMEGAADVRPDFDTL